MARNNGSSNEEDTFAITQGELLRTARGRMNLTLQDVEAATQGEFKAAGLSAYERGERSVATIRLLKLATLYGTELSDLIPTVTVEPTSTSQTVASSKVANQANRPPRSGVRLDLFRLQELKVPGAEQLRHFAQNVQMYRGGKSSQHLWLREDDLLAVAVMFETATDRVVEVMVELGIVDAL